MSVVSAIRKMIAGGLTIDQALLAAEAMEECFVEADSAKSERNARYYARLDVSLDVWQSLRRAVFERDNFTCVYCGIDVSDRPQCDHVTPLVAGGISDLRNLVTACKSCNSSKSGRLLDEWRRQ